MWILAIILIAHFALSVYGIEWGLPDRWNPDEQVAKTLRFITSRSALTVVDTTHPPFYNFILALFLIPYLLFLKISAYPLDVVQNAASVSWMHLAFADPFFAGNVYIIARLSSVVFGLLTVYTIYRIGKTAENTGVGLLSAAMLAVSMGFVAETNHFSKSTNLVLFLTVLVLYWCFKAVKEKKPCRYLYYASFICGLAIATKFDGAISLCYLTATIFLLVKHPGALLKKNIRQILLLFVFALIAGWPTLISRPHVFDWRTASVVGRFTWNGSLCVQKFIQHLLHISVIFGPLLSIFAYFGLFYFVFRKAWFLEYRKIFIAALIPYAVIISLFYTHFSGAYTKFMIHALPLLCLFGAKAMQEFFLWKKPIKPACAIFLTLCFFHAAVYSFNADTVFSKYDTRYASSRWLTAHIPKGAVIEHQQPMDFLFSSAIAMNYPVIYFGRNSQTYSGGSFYEMKDDASYQEYSALLEAKGSSADYYIVATGDDFFPAAEISCMSFICRLIRGEETGYSLMKKFEYKDNSFWKPKPAYTSPTIEVYKKIKLNLR